MGFILAPIKSFLLFIVEKILWKIFAILKVKILDYFENKKEDKTDKENIKKLEDSIKSNKSDEEISKNAEDLLNGNKR